LRGIDDCLCYRQGDDLTRLRWVEKFQKEGLSLVMRIAQVASLEDAEEAVRRKAQLSRKRCLEVFEQRFTARRMAHDYVQQFERLIARNQQVSEAA